MKVWTSQSHEQWASSTSVTLSHLFINCVLNASEDEAGVVSLSSEGHDELEL